MICVHNSNSINVENLTRSSGRAVLFQLNSIKRELRLNGWNYGHSIKQGPNFFEWFKDQVMSLCIRDCICVSFTADTANI